VALRLRVAENGVGLCNVDNDLIRLSQVAELAGVAEMTISTWRRSTDFPQPAAYRTPSRPLFSRQQVIHWLETNHKMPHKYETVIKKLRETLSDAEIIDLLSEKSLIGEARGFNLPTSKRENVCNIVNRIPKDELHLAADALYLLHPGLTAALIALASRKTDQENLAKIISELNKIAPAKTPSSFFDPTCGSGNIVVAIRRHFPEANVYGRCDDDRDLQACEKRAMLVDGHLHVTVADPFAPDENKADAVVSIVPNGKSFFTKYSRVFDIACVKNALQFVNDTGYAYLAVPTGAASNHSRLDIRRELLESGNIAAVISTPFRIDSGYRDIFVLSKQHHQKILFASLETGETKMAQVATILKTTAVSLTPSRYLMPEPVDAPISELKKEMSRLKFPSRSLSQFAWPSGSLVSLRELVEDGIIEMEVIGNKVVDGGEICFPLRRAKLEPFKAKKGDKVTSHCAVINNKRPDLLNSDYLEFALTGPWNWLNKSGRIKAEDTRIPWLSKAEQEEVAELGTSLVALRDASRRVTQLADESIAALAAKLLAD